MTLLAERYEIQQRDLSRLDDADLRSLARLNQVLNRERLPHEPPTPLELIERRLRHRPDEMEAVEWIAKDGGDVVAFANCIRWKSESNPHWRDAFVAVHPEHRRRGLATSLLARIAGACDDPETVLASNTNDRVPAGAVLATKLGAKEGLNNRASELDLRSVDRAMVREWASIDPAGYRLVWIDGDVPDELMANVLVAYDTMNTAPRGDLSFGDWRMTPEMVRDWERIRRENGGEHRLLLAVHDATGATAGFTEVTRHPMTPWVVGQNGTATVPEHRSHGIGKWMKAAMIERIFRDWPDAQFIRTGNAYSNGPMLSINDRLGFKIVLSVMVWQADLASVRRYVEARGR